MLQGFNSAKRMVQLGAAAALACAFAQPAMAQISQDQKAYYRDPALIGYVYPGPANAVLTIPVTASVGGTCGFTQAPNATFFNPDIDTTAWTNQKAFTVECTAPWRIAVSSQNGALKNSTATTAPGYVSVAPYDVTLNIPYDTGSSSGTVTQTCPVAEIDQALGSSACGFKGTASSSTGLLVPRSFGLGGAYIQLAAPAYAGPDVLVEGMYYDTLVVTVSPAS